MTILSTNAFSGPFTSNGSTTAFPFDFRAITASEVKVVRRSAAGIDTVLGGYSVVLTPTGGTVTFSTAPATGDPIYILSNPSLEQQFNFANQGSWSPTTMNQALDRAAVRDIYLNRKIDDTFAMSYDITGTPSVASRAALSLLQGQVEGHAVVLTEAGYEGLFVWRLGDFSANALSDPGAEFYIASGTIPATTGIWVRALRDLQHPPLAVPAGFDWLPPVNIYLSPTGVYSTNFDPEVWKSAATASLYVSQTGSDTTGNGTLANPYRTLFKAATAAGLLADDNINIFAEGGGEYTSSFQSLPAKNLNMISVGARALATNKVPFTSWTLDGAGTYKVTLTPYTVSAVRDWAFPVTWPNGEQSPQWLALAASKAACQATPSTYWTDGTQAWVHLQDGRVPDADIGEDVGLIYGISNTNIVENDSIYYFEGFDFEGSRMVVQPASMTTVKRVVLNDCRYYRGSFWFLNTELAISNNCRTFLSPDGDAFSYSPRAPGEPSTYSIEIDCHAYSPGGAVGPNDNGSTNHEVGRTVRVNCVYRNSRGPLCADVGAVQSWNLNVDAQDSLLTSNDENDACFVVGNSSSTACKSWLDGCTTGGSHFDFYVGPGCQLRYRNMALPASVGGAGTVSSY